MVLLLDGDEEVRAGGGAVVSGAPSDGAVTALGATNGPTGTETSMAATVSASWACAPSGFRTIPVHPVRPGAPSVRCADSRETFGWGGGELLRGRRAGRRPDGRASDGSDVRARSGAGVGVDVAG
ncbi:hypothetical protein GCM10020367_30300 [Streptomyces sannanensis]|uniref:Uncharacterized protein n=1 Tax=Streptomyces sannanensis TaxID=285536 RepID=A0ABP6SCA8_9ACTN